MLNEYCSKCGKALETPKSKIIGLGPDCVCNCRLVYDACVEKLQEKKQSLSGDQWFNWMGLMGNPLNAIRTQTIDAYKIVLPELKETLDRLSTALVSLGEDEIPSWQLILDAFSIARNSNEVVREVIHKSLIDLGFELFVYIATGDFCFGTATLLFDKEKNRFVLKTGGVRRSASEVFNILKQADPASVQRPNRELWNFALKHGQVVLDTCNKRFPLPGTFTIEPSFWEGLELSKSLPPEPKPEEIECFMDEIVSYRRLFVRRAIPDANGRIVKGCENWALPAGNDSFRFIMDRGGKWDPEFKSEEWNVYLVPEEKLEEIQAHIQELRKQKLHEMVPVGNKIVNGAAKKTRRFYR